VYTGVTSIHNTTSHTLTLYFGLLQLSVLFQVFPFNICIMVVGENGFALVNYSSTPYCTF